MKKIPTLSPAPRKLKPVTSNTASTASCLRIFALTFVMNSRVRAMVEPTGICTRPSAKPWSSSGTKLLGTRQNNRPLMRISATKPAAHQRRWRSEYFTDRR